MYFLKNKVNTQGTEMITPHHINDCNYLMNCLIRVYTYYEILVMKALSISFQTGNGLFILPDWGLAGLAGWAGRAARLIGEHSGPVTAEVYPSGIGIGERSLLVYLMTIHSAMREVM